MAGAEEKVFIPHLTECWAPAVLTGPNTYKLLDPCDVATTDSLKTVTYDAPTWKKLTAVPTLHGLPPFDQCKTAMSPIVDPLDGRDNIAEMQSVTEGSVIHAIRARYRKKLIYTDVGRIVVALNPFERRPDLYNEQLMAQYHRAEAPYTLPPHIYQVASGAYKGVSDDSRNQSTLITGESGAGKTESTKILLRFFAYLGAGPGISKEHTARASIEERIVMANPILESFGNASTSRNPNSSRFGKWVELYFDPTMRIRGATITSYMLEMPRICEHLHSDRNYHIFYQVVANRLGKTAGDTKAFNYLVPSPAPEGVTLRTHGQTVDDAKMHAELLHALKDFDFTANEQTGIFSLIGATLYLGNLTFEPATIKGGEASSIPPRWDTDLSTAANLIGVDVNMLRRCLLSRIIVTGKETMEVMLKPVDAVGARDGLAKLIYGSLFNWLLTRINENLAPRATNHNSIGILDIAGFECFDMNSFEQLLINLSNEKLQQHFNRDMIITELEDYKREGMMDMKLDFADNAPILSLIEGKGGIIDILDEELFVPKGTDEAFASKVVKSHGKAPNFVAPKFAGAPSFGVSHFAGPVVYTSTGWLDKNRLSPPREALEVLSSAHNNVVKQMVKLVVTDTKRTTIGGFFRKQLQELMGKIQATQTHYVRCMKPNAVHHPGQIESHELLRQLKCAGVMEAIRIRKSGYAFRVSFAEFVERYAILVGIEKPKDKGTCQQILALAKEKKGYESSDVFIAQTKVMLRENVRLLIDHMRVEAVEELKRPLLPYVEAYTKGAAQQDGMFLWPQPLLGENVATPNALEAHLQQLEAGLAAVKTKLGTLEHPPGWVGTAMLARESMMKEVRLVTQANGLLLKVKALCCDKELVKQLKAIHRTAREQGVKNGALEKIGQLVALIIEEEDWEAQLRGKDTDYASLLQAIDARRGELLTPSCHKLAAEARARLEADRQALEKAKEEEKAAAARTRAEDEARRAKAEAPKETADPALLKSDSITLADTLLNKTRPKMPPAKAGAGPGPKAQIARTIAKRPGPAPKKRGPAASRYNALSP